MDSIEAECLLDLNMAYGKWGENRFLESVNEKQERFGQKLDKEEIIAIYHSVNDELFLCL